MKDRYQEIIDYHRKEEAKKMAEIDGDLKKKLRIIYIVGAILFIVMIIAYQYIPF